MMTDLRSGTQLGGDADWEKDLANRDGYPLVAGLLAAMALIVAAVAARYAGFVGQSPFVLLGELVAAALVIWGVAYGVTLRHTGWLWRLGVLGVLLFLAVTIAVVQMFEDVTAASNELLVFRTMKIDDNGAPKLPPNADQGPISHAIVDYYKHLIAIQNDEEKGFKALGVDRLLEPQAISTDPALMSNCGRFAQFKPHSDDAIRRQIALTRELPRTMEILPVSPVVKRIVLAGMNPDLDRLRANLHAGGDRTDEELDEAAAMCVILARHRWKVVSGVPLFTNVADMNAINEHIRRWNALALAGQDALRAAREDRLP
jgi:hypothetical protein